MDEISTVGDNCGFCKVFGSEEFPLSSGASIVSTRQYANRGRRTLLGLLSGTDHQ